MHKTHRLSRLASVGLGAVLLVLTVFAIYAAAITFNVISQTTESVHITDLYQQAQDLIRTQESLEWQYQVQPTADVRTQFRATAARLITTFQLVSRAGNASDRARAERLITREKRYVLAVNRLFTAIDAGDNAICGASPVNNIDQRGYFRPINVTCDIGSFEANSSTSTLTPTLTPSLTLTPTLTLTRTPTLTLTPTSTPQSAPVVSTEPSLG